MRDYMKQLAASYHKRPKQEYKKPKINPHKNKPLTKKTNYFIFHVNHWRLGAF